MTNAPTYGSLNTPGYIFVFRSGFRGALNRIFTSASSRRHLSWLSKLSFFHASAIACAGEIVGLGGQNCFQLCGGGESVVIAVTSTSSMPLLGTMLGLELEPRAVEGRMVHTARFQNKGDPFRDGHFRGKSGQWGRKKEEFWFVKCVNGRICLSCYTYNTGLREYGWPTLRA